MTTRERLIRLMMQAQPTNETVAELCTRLEITLKDFFDLRADPRLYQWDDEYIKTHRKKSRLFKI